MKIYKCPKCTYFGTNLTSSSMHIDKHGISRKKLKVYETDDFHSAEFACKICEAEGNAKASSTQKTLKALIKHIRGKHHIKHPRSSHWRLTLMIDDKKIGVAFDTAFKNGRGKPATPETASNKTVNEPIKQAVPEHQAIVRIPVMLVVDLAAGTNSIEPISESDLKI